MDCADLLQVNTETNKSSTCNRKYKQKYKSTSRIRWQSSYVVVPYWADLILVEIGMSADEEHLLHSLFKPVFLSTGDSAAFPVNLVVFLDGMLCYP